MLRPRFRYPRNCSEVDAAPPIQISEELFRSRCCAPDSDIRGTVQKSMLRPRFRYPRNCSEVDAAPPIQISEELFRSRCCAPDSDIRGTVQKSMLRPRFRYPRNCSEVDAPPPIQISELGLVVKHGDDARVRLDQDRSFLDDVELFRLATPRTHAVDAADQE